MLRRSWFAVLPLLAAVLYLGTGPSQSAPSPRWTIEGINAVGCSSSDLEFPVTLANVDGKHYSAHTRAISDGKTYMNEYVTDVESSTDDTWSIYDEFTKPVQHPGTWPITSGKPVTLIFSLEKTNGTVLMSTSLAIASCDRGAIKYFGPTSLDKDNDFVAASKDLCPKLPAYRPNGCPLRDRTLTLEAKTKSVSGTLSAPGYPVLGGHKTVVLWKVKSGTDQKVATLTTTSEGKFSALVGPGSYYATSPKFVSPGSGEAAADTSPTVHRS